MNDIYVDFIPKAGLELIKTFEGLELDAYKDIANVWTIGYGHTGPVTEANASHGVLLNLIGRKPGPNEGDIKHITAYQAEMLLYDRLRYEFIPAINGLLKVPQNENQYGAVMSLVFNIGVNAFKGSTVRKRINKKDHPMKIKEAWEWWNKATIDGVLRESKGLIRRRAAETALYLTPTKEIKTINNTARIRALDT